MTDLIKSFTGSSHIKETISLNGMTSGQFWQLHEFRIHLSGAATATNNLTLTMRSHEGSAYDCNILTQDMTSVADVIWNDGPFKLRGTDRLVVAWTNDAASFKTWGFQVTLSA